MLGRLRGQCAKLVARRWTSQVLNSAAMCSCRVSLPPSAAFSTDCNAATLLATLLLAAYLKAGGATLLCDCSCRDETRDAGCSSEQRPKKEAYDCIRDETLFICGKDRSGRPTLVARPCMHQASSVEESYQAARACVEVVKECIALLSSPDEKIVIIYDLEGAKIAHLDLAFSRALVRSLREFPDHVGCIVVVNGTWSVRTAWRTVKSLLRRETQSKIFVCSSSTAYETLRQHLDDDHPYLPVAIGAKYQTQASI